MTLTPPGLGADSVTVKAAAGFRRALELAALPAERTLLERRLARCEG